MPASRRSMRDVPERGDLVWVDFTPHAGHGQGGRRPALVISPRYYNSNAGFAGKDWIYDLILTVSVPIYDRGVRYAQLHEDQARLARAQADLATVRARARSNWIGARANLVAADAVLRQSESQSQLATRAQAQVDASYRAGVATSLDVSVADQEKFAAQSTAAQARAQLEIRRAELAAAAGRLYESSR